MESLGKGVRKIRDAVYGFVEIDEQECEIINHPKFQRLRRIRQLSLTDMVYPGATHTRFEHSIGVMQMATDIFDCIIKKKRNFLNDILSLEDPGIALWRKTIRLAALLHDVGHAPFSHAGEDLMPQKETGKGKRYEHEDYSIVAIKTIFKKIIEEHKINQNFNITTEKVTALLGDKSVKQDALSLLWKDIISGQLDADRADYLLRDSLHLGVNYGLYDRNRLINCMTLAKDASGNLVIAIEEKGWNTAESLVIARYQMFSQVYFHKTRRIYDYHIYCAVKEVLKNLKLKDAVYPRPNEIEAYLEFDDWTIYSALKNGFGGEHGHIILGRNHYKCLMETQAIPTESEEYELEELRIKYGENGYLDDKLSTSWYKSDLGKDILISGARLLQPLSVKSNIVKSMIAESRQKRFYIKRETL